MNVTGERTDRPRAERTLDPLVGAPSSFRFFGDKGPICSPDFSPYLPAFFFCFTSTKPGWLLRSFSPRFVHPRGIGSPCVVLLLQRRVDRNRQGEEAMSRITCKNCGEKNERKFDKCWNCEWPLIASEAKSAEVRRGGDGFPVEASPDVKCATRCSVSDGRKEN